MPEERDKSETGIDRDTVINAGMQLIPYVGASIAALYFGSKQERRFRRIESFYEEVKDEVSGMRDRIADLGDHDPSEFRAILEELHEEVEAEQLESKRKYYKTYFKSTLVDPVRGNFEERKLLLDVLGDLTPLQIEILAFLVNHGQPVPAGGISKPGVDPALIGGALGQLRNYGLVTNKLDSIAFGSAGGSVNESVEVSAFGRRFHKFCIEGEA